MHETKPEMIGLYNNGLKNAGGAPGTGTEFSATVPSATLTTEGVVKTCNASSAEVTSETVSVVPTMWYVQNAIAQLTGGTYTIPDGGTQTVEIASAGTSETGKAGIIKPSSDYFTVAQNGYTTLNAATTQKAGVVTTCNESSTQVTSESVAVVPTQYFLQQQIARLDQAIGSANSTTIHSSSIISSSIVSAAEATLQSAGIVTTCNESSAQVTSETVSIVPTQYYVQQEIARLDQAIESGGGGGGSTPAATWTSVTDLGSASSATFEAGNNYRMKTTSDMHTLTAITSGGSMVGADSRVMLRVREAATVTVLAPLVLTNELQDYSLNVCTVRYCDGKAFMTVDFYTTGYYVTVNDGIEGDEGEGSILYGLQSATQSSIRFDASVNGATCNLQGAIMNSYKDIVGNGMTNTVLSGVVVCGHGCTFEQLSMEGIIMMGGSATLVNTRLDNFNNSGTITFSGYNELAGDFYAGAPVHVSGITKIKGVNGSGSLRLGGSYSVIAEADTSAYFYDLNIIRGAAGNGGVIGIGSGKRAEFVNCTISANSASQAGAVGQAASGGVLVFSNCIIASNSTTGRGLVDLRDYGSALFYGCTFSSNTANSGGGMLNTIGSGQYVLYSDCHLDGSLQASGKPTMVFDGSNTYYSGYTKQATGATAVIAAGGIMDVTGNTGDTSKRILNCASVFVGSQSEGAWVVGGTATFITSGGQSVTIEGSGSVLKNDGTLS